MKQNFFSALAIVCLGLGMTACTKKAEQVEQLDQTLTASGLDFAKFDTDSTKLYAIANEAGMEVCLTNFGGRIVSIMVPNKDGQLTDVCLGHENIQDYETYGAQGCNFGALIGRYGNRIAKGQFTLDGESYQLPINNGPNSLHGGGPVAFHNRIWDVAGIGADSIQFTTTSADGEDGYPGNIEVMVTYKVTDQNALSITYEAKTDKATVLNLTNHCYFNLSGDGTKDCLDEVLQIDADSITAVDADVAVTGEVLAVEGSAFDFRTPTAVGDRIDAEEEQIQNGKGYDHNWILNTKGDITRCFATIWDPNTGIQMEMFTDQPGVQIYSANFLTDETLPLCGNRPQEMRAAICLETQHFPDSPNKPQFPSVVLRPGEIYDTTTIYRFSTF